MAITDWPREGWVFSDAIGWIPPNAFSPSPLKNYWTCPNCGQNIGNGMTHMCWCYRPPTTIPLDPICPLPLPRKTIPQQGWECPRCKRINAPFVNQCDCADSQATTSDDTAPTVYTTNATPKIMYKKD